MLVGRASPATANTDLPIHSLYRLRVSYLLRCGSTANPIGYRTLSPDPMLWEQTEDPRWALRHAEAHGTVYDDCGPKGCEVGGVHQPISFAYRMPACSDERGEPREPEDCEEHNAGYSHACRARLEPFASWPATSGRAAAFSSAESNARLVTPQTAPSRFSLLGSARARLLHL